MSLAPVILFVYNRPQHTLQVLESISHNDLAAKTTLYIFADGPKENAIDSTLQRIAETRRVIGSRKWCKEVIIVEQGRNKGLANSVIDGVTEVINRHGHVIVLEDDLVVSRYFLKYMNDALNVYEQETKVISIHGYNFPIESTDLPPTFFMKGADCWGWATWSDRWQLYEKDASKLLLEIETQNLEKEFDLDNSYPYTKMLRDQVTDKIDSWAIRWHATAFLLNKYTVFPKDSLVTNIGFDNSGVHSRDEVQFNNKNWNHSVPVVVKRIALVKTNTIAFKRWKKYLLSLNYNIGRKQNSFHAYGSFLIKAYSRLKLNWSSKK